MTTIKKLNVLFLIITSLGVILLIGAWYNNYQFSNNPLSNEIQKKILEKENEIKRQIKKHYNLEINIPLIVSDKMNSKLFGMAIFDETSHNIAIYLNKKRFKESENYMLNDVLPHEYAHALMFVLGDFSKTDGGHSLKWQRICKKLNGSRCDRFVNHNDIIFDKTKLPF